MARIVSCFGILLALLICSYSAGTANAQTILNVPPNPAPGSIGAGTTLNLNEGGVLPFNFQAFRDSTLNIYGGSVEGRLLAQDGSFVNIAGGVIGGSGSGVNGLSLLPQRGSTLFISGGAIGNSFYAETGVSVTFEGFDFRLNGELIDGLSQPGDTRVVAIDLVGISSDFAFTGILSDGTPFTYSDLRFDQDMFSSDVTLIRAAAPPTYPTSIIFDGVIGARGALPGQTVSVGQGFTLPDHYGAAHGSAVEVRGGAIGENFEADAANVTVMNGSVGRLFSAIQGSMVRITDSETAGGLVIGGNAQLHASNSEINSVVATDNSHIVVDGGSVGSIDLRNNSRLELRNTELIDGIFAGGSSVLLESGVFEARITINESSLVVRGGQFGSSVWSLSSDSDATLVGRDFLLNGSPLAGFDSLGSKALPIVDGDTLSGVLADGTAFEVDLYSRSGRPVLPGMHFRADSTLRLIMVPEPSALLSTSCCCVLILARSSRQILAS